MGGSTEASATLARYASDLCFADVPPPVRDIARAVVIDTVGVAVHGHTAPAAQMVLDYVMRQRSWGRAYVLGGRRMPVRAEDAAFANGVLTHAVGLDTEWRPAVGVHLGAALVPAALAVAQEEGLGGRALLTAIVAGSEVMARIGLATRGSIEERGLHAAGLIGPFGAAVAAGQLLGLDAAEMQNALGIAASLGSGLLECLVSGSPDMMQPLHVGRAAASGVLAARLAQSGFTAPTAVLEGENGFLQAYCSITDAAALTAGLGERFETTETCFKAYACPMAAATSVHAAWLLQQEHGFAGRDVVGVQIEGTPLMAVQHGDRSPPTAAAARRSIPHCVAAALFNDPRDPAVFHDSWGDGAVAELCENVEVSGEGGFDGRWTTRTRIWLADGRGFEMALDVVPGMPERPFDAAQRRAKFMTLTRRLGDRAAPLLARLETLDTEAELGWLDSATTPVDA